MISPKTPRQLSYERTSKPASVSIQRGIPDPYDEAEAIFDELFVDDPNVTDEQLEAAVADVNAAATSVSTDMMEQHLKTATSDARKEGIIIGAAVVLGLGVIYALFT